MLRKPVLWVALALAGATPSGAGQGAVALSLPKESLSLWRIGSTAVYGLDLNASFHRSARESSSSHRRHVAFGLTRQSPPPSGKVELFRFSRIGGLHAAGSAEQTLWAVDATTGFGVCWKPFEKVGLWLRNGVTAYYRRVESGRTEMRIAIDPTPQAMAFFVF